MGQQNTRNPLGSQALRRSPVVAGLVIGALLGTGAAGLALKGLARAATRNELAVAARTAPTRPLPAEWRWSPPGVEVEHMFRKPGR